MVRAPCTVSAYNDRRLAAGDYGAGRGNRVAAVHELPDDSRMQAGDALRLAGDVGGEDKGRVGEMLGPGGRGLGRQSATADEDVRDLFEDWIASLGCLRSLPR